MTDQWDCRPNKRWFLRVIRVSQEIAEAIQHNHKTEASNWEQPERHAGEDVIVVD